MTENFLSPTHGPILVESTTTSAGPSLESQPAEAAQAADVPSLIRRAQLALGLGCVHPFHSSPLKFVFIYLPLRRAAASDAAKFIHYVATSSTHELTEEQRSIFASAHHHYIVSLLEQRRKLERLVKEARHRATGTSCTDVPNVDATKPDISGPAGSPSSIFTPTYSGLDYTSSIKSSPAAVAALLDSRALQDYLGNVEFKLRSVVDEVIRTISQQLLPRAQSDAAVIWGWTMLGHYYRYAAQITVATVRYENKIKALSYYQKAMDVLLAKPGAYLEVEQTKSTLKEFMQEVSLV
uniref:14-3-3 domain-containing protein n=1 Tax=Mycena chlorophos TaxID=658473 RepID=A0ABQ0KWB2_MYCCL|nr:predicted protein [Mycena chlorophos]